MTDRALTQNASSGKQVRRAGQREKRAARQRALDTVAVMASPEGRRFVWWLLRRAGVTQSVLRDGEARALYWAGRQDMGHELLEHVITTDPDAYLLMQREAIDATKAEQATAPEEEAGMASEKSTDGEDDEQ